MRQILLLRGINLGAHNRISMPELRLALEREGFADVRTYLQSGNVVVSSDAPADELAAQAQQALARRFGLDVDVIVRTRDELAEVIARDPLGEVAVNPKRYQVSFLARELDAAALRQLAALAAPSERLVGTPGGTPAGRERDRAQLDDSHEPARAGRRVSARRDSRRSGSAAARWADA
jgi:uncharacterized protein (DUF1697 family)